MAWHGVRKLSEMLFSSIANVCGHTVLLMPSRQYSSIWCFLHIYILPAVMHYIAIKTLCICIKGEVWHQVNHSWHVHKVALRLSYF
jgi:small-conductance mechanosensitive channel